jgi:putative DNA primase/helicase
VTNVTNLEKAAAKLASKGKKPTRPAGDTYDANGRRVIRHEPGELPSILDQVETALSESPEQNVYRYAGRLARVYQAEEPADKSIKRPAGAIMVHPVESPLLAELAGRAALHEKFDARSSSYKPCDCPRRVADALLSRGHWPRLPDLAGFIEAPTITDENRIIDQPGYDPASGLFCAFAVIPGYAPPPPIPTKDDAMRAADKLVQLVSSFPFVDATDRAAILAGILTALQRRLLPAAPLVAITAPTPGTSKTLLCEMLAIIATGRRASVLSLGHDDAETEKRLAGVFLAGDAVISVDNIERPLKGDLLCQVATQQFVRLRPLGGSGMLNVPTHALLVATGNNLAVVGDLKRRVIMVRLDAKTERPEHRAFDNDFLKDIGANRGQIITWGLTIVAAYLTAGSPKIADLHGFGGFEQWDRMVRLPLAWLNFPDPLLTSEELREQDPDLEATRLLFAAWSNQFGVNPQTAADVVAAGMQAGPISFDKVNPELYDALQLVCSEKPNARRLGYWLRAHRNRIVDGLTLTQANTDGHAKVARWRVTTAGNAGHCG